MIKLLKLQKTKTKLFIEPENRKMEKFSAKRKTSNFNVYLTLILTLTLTLTDGGLTFNGGRFERTDGSCEGKVKRQRCFRSAEAKKIYIYYVVRVDLTSGKTDLSFQGKMSAIGQGDTELLKYFRPPPPDRMVASLFDIKLTMMKATQDQQT